MLTYLLFTLSYKQLSLLEMMSIYSLLVSTGYVFMSSVIAAWISFTGDVFSLCVADIKQQLHFD